MPTPLPPDDARPDDSSVAWRPDDATRERAQLTRFMRANNYADFDDLMRRSTDDPAEFTGRVLDFLGLEFDPPYASVMDVSRGIEHARWCVGGGFNVSQACVDRHAAGELADTPAVVWEGEEGAVRSVTYAELARMVARCAAGLRALGIAKGDAVAIHMPMMVETAVALLAAARVGAIAVPVFSGYGPSAIEARVEDVGARLLFTCDAFPRRGTPVRAKQVADEAVARCPSVEHVVVARRLNVDVPMREGRDLFWDDLLARGDAAAEEAERIEPTGAEDPLLIIYTSGTTGRPKGILHTHCGFPIKSAQDMCFGTDVGARSRIAWVTDIGWMMGPWLIYGATMLGATMVLFDGAPDFPEPDRMWAFAAKHRVEILGISPTLVRALAARGDDLPAAHNLSALRAFASTGEPWNPDPWWWLFRVVGRERVPIINYSGGTEISGGILMGNPLLPIKPASFSAPCPGMAADVVDDAGAPVRGRVGELAIRKPWIGMARGFWKDEARYLETYWSKIPGLWVHGDWALVDEDGHWFILGRSDDTLKVAGKRVGPAEVESILVTHDAVVEAAVIGVPDEDKGTAMIALCVTTPGTEANEALAAELARRVGEELGKPLRPSRVLFVEALPRTRNGKVMRRVIRAAYLGSDAGDLSALENPSAVDAVRALAPGAHGG